MIKRKGNRFTGFLLFVGLIGLSLIQSACDTTPSQAAASTPIEATIADTLVQATDIYGIPLDIYHIQEGKVGRNQTLSDLLQPLGLTLQEIYHISQLPDSLVNERKIKQGNRYLFYSKADTVSDLPLFAESVFIYEKDLLNFVAISIDPDTLWARNGQKPVKTRLQVASGTIETSLWESMLATDANPMLAIELSEIFAWTIDFFGIQQGDRYKVIYEESFVDSNSRFLSTYDFLSLFRISCLVSSAFGISRMSRSIAYFSERISCNCCRISNVFSMLCVLNLF